MDVSRRVFLKYTSATALTVFAVDALGVPRAVASIPGGTLDPATIDKFRTAMLVPPEMPKSATLHHRGRPTDYYEISMRQFPQQILPEGMPLTTVWGYGPLPVIASGTPRHHAPSYTIEARHGRATRVKWVNELVDWRGRYLPHLLPVDPSLHWANPGREPNAMGVERTDSRPAFAGKHYVPPEEYDDPATEYTLYRGPVPVVTHVHGAMGVGDESDGYTEAWYLPDATNLPPELSTRGRWYDYFEAKAVARFGESWGPGFATFQYPNDNRASTLWYHDHALGMTRTNVYAGPAGFYLVRGGPGSERDIVDTRSGFRAVLPGPRPKANDAKPKRYREVPIVIQDRSFNADGSLFYPDTRAFFDEYAGPFVPESPLPPAWNPEFFGNTLIVNGTTWPVHKVDAKRHRFRFLNGCQSRFLILDFSGIPGIDVWQIGADGGLLPEAVAVSRDHGGRVILGPAERADLIVDFAHVPRGVHVLRNVGPDEPFGGGEPDADFDVADPDTTGQVMAFKVVKAGAADKTTPPEFMRLPSPAVIPPSGTVRRVALLEHAHEFAGGGDGPAAALLGVVEGDPSLGPAPATARMWMEPLTEVPAVGSSETWEIYNLTADAHPVHLHEVAFEVAGRQDILVGDGTVEIEPGAPVVPPHPWEAGRKDTVIAEPEQVTRIRAHFRTAGRYVWHCHILEHEDNEMMRPFHVGPLDPAAPDADDVAMPPMP